jgi:phage FluMu protein Com
MNLRCAYCQTPFTMGRNQMLIAIQALHTEGLHHYDVHCPRCRKANQVPLDRLERAYPNWQEALATLKSESAADETTDQKPE